jgi:hypothetical protein
VKFGRYPGISSPKASLSTLQWVRETDQHTHTPSKPMPLPKNTVSRSCYNLGKTLGSGRLDQEHPLQLMRDPWQSHQHPQPHTNAHSRISTCICTHALSTRRNRSG